MPRAENALRERERLGEISDAFLFSSFVIAGLDPAIHAAVEEMCSMVFGCGESIWTTGSSPVVTEWEERCCAEL